ncbi:MAG: transglycosylase SLT domain-containing protein [Nitrospira sp.]|nr:transglycosylase SLT domain-containing protein [Nitrospira sp.]MCP9441573.1 transglycosylase SLT domain-containing protein [Nitrospira sp.]
MTKWTDRLSCWLIRHACVMLGVAALFVVVTDLTSPFNVYSAQAVSADLQQTDRCEAAEECFAMAVRPREQLGAALTKDQVAALKLERLRQVMERFPASLWAKRAGLLSGVMLIDRYPAVALSYLRAAQRDFPAIEDYVRYWVGEALLSLGDAREAALTFDSVPQAVPDTNLLPQVLLRAGEAWHQTSSCPEAIDRLTRAVTFSRNEKDPRIAQAWLRLADCYLHMGKPAEGREALTKVWITFPHTKEAKQAEALLETSTEGKRWAPKAQDFYARAQVLLGQALHKEAIEELKRFLAEDPPPPLRSEATLKLGVAQVRLKLYEQARETFQGLVEGRTTHAGEATVWLARVYLRQGLGDKLLDLSRRVAKRNLSAEQQGQINLFAGIWLEDQARFDEAIAHYRQVAQTGEPAAQRTEARWRQGWVLYRIGRYQAAIDVWRPIVERPNSEWEPQVLYWIARAYGHVGSSNAQETFQLLCNRYPYTYYCQLAQGRAGIAAMVSTDQERRLEEAAAVPAVLPSLPDRDQMSGRNEASRSEIERQPAYRRAAELKALGLEQDVVRELTALTDAYGNDDAAVVSLSVMLSEAGAYHHALRLVRSRFRDKLERGGGVIVEDGLWNAAYPMGLISTINMQGVDGVDPFLVAAIIREESQYDWRAVSRVGAIGLMQVMPATANEVAQHHRLPEVTRDDLFDQETNIQIGVRYIGQLLARFSGNLVHAVAAYNAGPLAVESWVVAHRGRSDDEFVELIPFQETRQYVKRVLRSYKEYVRLNGLQKPVS